MGLVRAKRRGCGEEDEARQGPAVCGPGVLQLLHHVSRARSRCGLPRAHECSRLLFMTYNGWVMLSVAVGAFIGYLAFGSGSASKDVSCH